MPNKRINEEIRLYYAVLRDEAAETASVLKSRIWAAHPELALVEEEIVAEGFNRLRSALESAGEQSTANTKFDALVAKRSMLLQRLGLAEDYAPIVYRCAFCHDYGYIANKPCPDCYPQALASIWNTSTDEDPLGEVGFDKFDLELFEDSEDFNASPKRRMQALKLRMENYVESFSRHARSLERPNLLFNGITGTGKTFLALCIAKALREAGYSVMILSAPQLMRIFSEYRVLSNSYNPNSERMEQLSASTRQLNYCDFLLIDDLGTEAMDAHSAGDFLSLLNQRERSKKPILLTTNMDLRQLKERYEERIYSRIAGTFQTYAFIGSDLRVKKRKS